MQKLKGKVALVTGAGGWNGIGRAIALRLAVDGADLAIADIKHSPKEVEDAAGKRLWLGTDSVAHEIEAMGAKALPLNFDIRSEKEVDEAIAKVIKQFGRIDILVNNAGAAQGRDRVPAVNLPLEEWDRVIETNLNGTFLVSRAAAREMIRAGKGGKMVIISSVAGRQGRANNAAYSSSKFGLIGLTQALARELGQYQVNVNAVCPGTIVTSRIDDGAKVTSAEVGLPWQEVRERFLEQRKEWTALRRLGTVEDIANLVGYLVSPESDFITGQAIVADGGLVTI